MFRKITHIAIILVLLLSTTGLSISKHYCGSDFISTSITIEQKCDCDDETATCCTNETEYKQLEDDFVSSSSRIDYKNEIYFLSYFYAISISCDIFQSDFKILKPTANLKPPPGVKTILSQLQTYLI